MVQWLRDNLKLIERASDVETLAESVTSSEGVVFVPAFAGLGSPHWDPDARGTLLGITRGTGPAHIARAGPGSHCLPERRPACRHAGRLAPDDRAARRCGATANNLLMQIQADLLACR